jgi:predicted MFS family arabinose efflux permease
LDGLNFFLADVQTGVGPFLAIYLADCHWSQQRVGVALTVGGIAGILSQTPAGELVDRVRSKRTLIGVGVVGLAIGAGMIAFFPSFLAVMAAQILIGGTSSIFVPCICAMALGIVGAKGFDRRQGRNQTFNSAGNVSAALAMGLLGYFVSNRAIFFFVAVSAVPTLLCLGIIDPGDIDYEQARGSRGAKGDGKPAKVLELLRDRRLVLFLVCAVLFHFANAAMLPLLGEMLSRGKGRSSMMFMSACVITTQLVITLLASWTGRLASRWGRKPLLLVAFAVLPVRGILYTLTDRAGVLVAIQVLDGVGAGLFGVVSVLVIADLTRGSGRFNLTQGLIATAVGIGGALSQSVAGTVVQHLGYRAGFVFLAMIAAIALGIFWAFMPETLRGNQPEERVTETTTAG